MFEEDTNPGVELIVAMVGASVTETLLDRYVELSHLFTEMNYDSHIEELDILYSKLNSQSIDFLMARESIYSIMMAAVNYCLNRSGVEISDDTQLSCTPDLLRYIVQFEPTEDPYHIFTLIDEAEDNVDSICRLLELKTEHDRTFWYDVVTEVNDSTIGAILAILTESIERQDSYDGEKLVTDPELRLRKAILRDTGLESDLGDYVTESSSLNELYDKHIDRFVAMDMDDSIRELVGLGVLSNEGSNVSSAISGILDDMYFDPLERLEANKRLSKLTDKHLTVIPVTDYED